MVKVSVIMACRNASVYIEKAINSVLNQTFSDLELIIVDDASIDDSLSIAKKAANNDRRVRVYSLNSNLGAGYARNFAIDKANGEWLAILDADDVFIPDKLRQQIKVIERKDSNLVMIGSDSYEIRADGQRFATQRYPSESENLIYNLIRRKRFPPHSSHMYRTDIVRDLGCYNTRYRLAQDYDLWLRLSSCGSFYSISEPLIEYRHHGANLSNSNAGFDQVMYGYAASVCHFARLKNKIDPSVSLSFSEWEAFIKWIAEYLEKKNIQKIVKKKMRWRNKLIANDNNLIRTVKLANFFLENPLFAYHVLIERYWGTVLPELLADKWINSIDQKNRMLKNN